MEKSKQKNPIHHEHFVKETVISRRCSRGARSETVPNEKYTNRPSIYRCDHLYQITVSQFHSARHYCPSATPFSEYNCEKPAVAGVTQITILLFFVYYLRSYNSPKIFKCILLIFVAV